MGKATDKQVFYLKSKNIDASNMDYETASKLIGQFKNQANPQAPIPAQVFAPAQQKSFDNSSYYVAYTKDIVIALLSKVDIKEVTNVDKLIETFTGFAIKSVLDAREAFSSSN